MCLTHGNGIDRAHDFRKDIEGKAGISEMGAGW